MLGLSRVSLTPWCTNHHPGWIDMCRNSSFRWLVQALPSTKNTVSGPTWAVIEGKEMARKMGRRILMDTSILAGWNLVDIRWIRNRLKPFFVKSSELSGRWWGMATGQVTSNQKWVERNKQTRLRSGWRKKNRSEAECGTKQMCGRRNQTIINLSDPAQRNLEPFFTQNCDMMDLMDASWCFWCKLRIPCGFGFHCMLWGAHSFTWFQPHIPEQNPFTNKSGNLVVSGFSVVSTMLMQNADGAWSELLVKLDKVDSGPLAAPWPKHTIMDLFKIAG